MDNQSTENELLITVDNLKKEGYSQDFSYHNDHIHAIQGNTKIEAHDFNVEKAFKFEWSTSGDCSAVYALSSDKNNIKGVLVDYYNTNFRELNNVISEKFDVKPIVETVDESKILTRYGMNKIFKETFNENPERFELRYGFPDFPLCPFGNSFKMLGYDLQNKEYVWLVTSIIRDHRLKEVKFNA